MSDSNTTEVEVSGEVHAGYSTLLRAWSGWDDAALVYGEPGPEVSPFARTWPDERKVMLNLDRLVLNPNRVILTFTPFRVRQEAIVTGALLHEAGHARHSRWLPAPATHADGVAVADQSIGLARVCEEARVEALMATHPESAYLGWTLRATAAYLLPSTNLDGATDAEQVMATINSWCLRAGRQIALRGRDKNYTLPSWVGEFNSLLTDVLKDWFRDQIASGERPDLDAHPDPAWQAMKVTAHLREMFCASPSVDPEHVDSGTYMIDQAREVLETLFADAGSSPAPADPHGGEQSEDESDDQDSGEGQVQAEDGEPGDGTGGGEDGEDGATSSTETSQSEQSDQSGSSEARAAAQAVLDSMEAQADKAVAETSATEQAKTPPPESQASGLGFTNHPLGRSGGAWRLPTSEEREVARGASRFLRNLVEPTESPKVLRTETPSATVDAAEMAAWKAGGQVRDPLFFRRTQRSVVPAPPVRIAVAVDVSVSMDVMVKPSALLSWALTSAAVDLRNFAGRGVQIEACLIHWGNHVDTIAGPGKPMPMMLDHDCNQGTSAHGEAMRAVETALPGFFDASTEPVNRLLVNFTDWIFGNDDESETYMAWALANGVNCLSVVPQQYRPDRSQLTGYLERNRAQSGRHSLVQYNDMFDGPALVWAEATRLLG